MGEDADTVAQTRIGRGLLKKKKKSCLFPKAGRPPAAPHGHVLRRPTEEGVQQEAGLHQREGTWVPANVRERGQLRSHPQEEEEVVQERRLCCGGRLRVRLRLRGLRLLPEEDEVLHLPASVAWGGARAPARAEARPAPRALAVRCAPRAALADL